MEKADGDVDLLLTCEWPAGVTTGAAPLPDAANRTADDPIVAELAVAIRPRSASHSHIWEASGLDGLRLVPRIPLNEGEHAALE